MSPAIVGQERCHDGAEYGSADTDPRHGDAHGQTSLFRKPVRDHHGDGDQGRIQIEEADEE